MGLAASPRLGEPWLGFWRPLLLRRDMDAGASALDGEALVGVAPPLGYLGSEGRGGG